MPPPFAVSSSAGGLRVLDPRERVAELYRTYGPAIYRRCLRLLGDTEAARDATQEVFGKLMRDARKLETRDSALPWIYRVATNHCLNLRRNAARRGEEALPDFEMASPESPDLVPERQLAQRVLERFDTQTQAVAIGVFVDGMEHDEVAQALGISRRTVARKLQRFLGNARKYVARSVP
jgi:RNA polymerase sigma-70 factor (ECF subfamily)